MLAKLRQHHNQGALALSVEEGMKRQVSTANAVQCLPSRQRACHVLTPHPAHR